MLIQEDKFRQNDVTTQNRVLCNYQHNNNCKMFILRGRNNFRHRVNLLRLVLNPRARSASLGVESVGTTSGNGGIALFHPKRARAALVSSRGH